MTIKIPCSKFINSEGIKDKETFLKHFCFWYQFQLLLVVVLAVDLIEIPRAGWPIAIAAPELSHLGPGLKFISHSPTDQIESALYRIPTLLCETYQG